MCRFKIPLSYVPDCTAEEFGFIASSGLVANFPNVSAGELTLELMKVFALLGVTPEMLVSEGLLVTSQDETATSTCGEEVFTGQCVPRCEQEGSNDHTVDLGNSVIFTHVEDVARGMPDSDEDEVFDCLDPIVFAADSTILKSRADTHNTDAMLVLWYSVLQQKSKHVAFHKYSDSPIKMHFYAGDR